MLDGRHPGHDWHAHHLRAPRQPQRRERDPACQSLALHVKPSPRGPESAPPSRSTSLDASGTSHSYRPPTTSSPKHWGLEQMQDGRTVHDPWMPTDLDPADRAVPRPVASSAFPMGPHCRSPLAPRNLCFNKRRPTQTSVTSILPSITNRPMTSTSLSILKGECNTASPRSPSSPSDSTHAAQRTHRPEATPTMHPY